MNADQDQPVASAIGFVGLGQIGGAIAAKLLRTGVELVVCDLREEALAPALAAGATRARDAAALARNCDLILTSLPSSEAFVWVAEHDLLPAARPGQVIIDLGTTTPPETRRLAERLAERGAVLLDIPVSGGAPGAESGSLYMFGGGDVHALERVRPLLACLGNLTVCGPSGAGQAVKGVNQLMMGLGWAAYLEAMAYGVSAGVDPAVIADAIGSTGRWRADFHAVATWVASGGGDAVSVKFRELPYFLRDAQERGVPLPITSAVYAFCAAGDRVAFDDHRKAPSYWLQLVGDARCREPAMAPGRQH